MVYLRIYIIYKVLFFVHWSTMLHNLLSCSVLMAKIKKC